MEKETKTSIKKTMVTGESTKRDTEKTDEQKIFELGCEVSMVREYIVQLANELNSLGINVSTTIKKEDYENII